MSIFNSNIFKGIFGTTISVFCFFIFFNKIDDLGKVIEIVTSVDFLIILLGFLVYFFSIYFRTIRWNSIFQNKIKIKLTSLSRIVISGYMFNNLLPARLGELARIYHFNLVKKIDKSYLFGTILAERITDVIALFIFIGVGIFFVPKDLLINLSDELGVNINLIYLFLILIGLSIVFFVLMQFKKYRKIITTFIPKFNFINNKILNIVDSFFKGLFNLEKNKIIYIIFLALIIWIIEFSMFYIVETQIELNLDSTFLAIVFFGVFANLSGIVPSTSGV